MKKEELKNQSKKSARNSKKEFGETVTPEISNQNSGEIKVVSKTKKLNKKVVLVLLTTTLVLGVAALIFTRYQGLVVAATVDNKIIFRWELDKKLTQRYATQTLDDLVTYKLIKNELMKQKVQVTDAEVNNKVKEIEGGLNGASLEDALKMQNMTVADLKEQIYLQLGIEKLLADKVVVTDDEVNEFVKTYSDSLQAQDEAGKKLEAAQNIRSQKLQSEVGTWVSGLREKAKVVKFL